jgi:hypothetical protein
MKKSCERGRVVTNLLAQLLNVESSLHAEVDWIGQAHLPQDTGPAD